MEPAYARFFQRLVVSCQAPEGHAFHRPGCMADFAAEAVQAGAAGIRANGAADLRAIRQAVSVPIIGILKAPGPDGKTLITGSVEAAAGLVAAGADVIALDCTARGRRFGALERAARIRRELQVPVMADIATVEEAGAAAAAGVDLVASTLRGYTEETAHVAAFEESFIAELAGCLRIPVLAEGRVTTPAQAAAALRAGAYAVIVGTAITNPRRIAEGFVQALQRECRKPLYVIGLDLGGTNTKYGVVSAGGELSLSGSCPTPWPEGRAVLLDHLTATARECRDRAEQAGIRAGMIGVSTAGWVDPHTGTVVYATENLPGWTGTRIAEHLEAELGLPAAVENDANALAVAERQFGAARGIDDFICVTLGTGVGGGCYVGGRLNRGAHYFANAIGHLQVEPDGEPCTCGRRGCLEAYANAAALLRYAGGGAFRDARELIAAARTGDQSARGALRQQAQHLAVGLAMIVELLDPELVVLSGGLAQDNPVLLEAITPALRDRLSVWAQRRLSIRFSELGYWGGVLGAAAVALASWPPK